jgi:2-oxoglutarate ferredoxin oxidoreductase subunit gamma
MWTMRIEVMFAGFGGQGVIKAALLLSQAAGLYENKEVAQTQSYGPEARGGACRSEVVISDQVIDYIKTMSLDSFVVMSQPAFDKYRDHIDPQKTIVIADTTLIKDIPPDVQKVYAVEATRIAEEKLGRALFANIIMLGALSAVSGLVTLDALRKCLVGNVPPKTLDQNQTALKTGYDVGTELVQASKPSVA